VVDDQGDADSINKQGLVRARVFLQSKPDMASPTISATMKFEELLPKDRGSEESAGIVEGSTMFAYSRSERHWL